MNKFIHATFYLLVLQLNYIPASDVVLNAFVKAINILKGGRASGDRHGRRHWPHSGADDGVGVRETLKRASFNCWVCGRYLTTSLPL